MEKENQDDYTVKLKTPLPDLTLSRTGLYGELHSAKYTAPDTSPADAGEWTIQIQKQGALNFTSLEPDEIKNLVMVISFETVSS